jgi:translation initiation factor 2 subunit 2
MAEEEANFDPSLKKKKKKKKTFDLEGALGEGGADEAAQETEETLEPAKDDADDIDLENFGKKKKKKKKVLDDDAEEKGDEEKDEKEDLDDLDLESFGEKKKKKKKKKPLDMEELEEALPGDDKAEDNDDLDLESFGTKKKKKKKIKNDMDDMDDENKENEGENGEATAWGEDRDYTYDELLQRVYNVIKEKNPDSTMGEKKKFVMRPPQVVKVGAKKTAFVNFTEIAKMLHRQPKHLLAFLFAELGTTGALDGSSQLVMKGKFQQKHIENVLRRYIKEYVTCHTCRSPDTILNKETRLFFLQCMTCHSRCSVLTIKTGFQAVTGKRSAIRAKQ